MENEAVLKEEKNKSLMDFIDSHPKTTFLTKALLWAIFSCGLPFLFIAYRFQIFHTVSKIQIGGWGLIGIIIVAVFVITVLKYLKLALKAGYSYWGQIINGICKVVVPLLALEIILYNIRNNIDLFMQVVGCVAACEFVGIFLNPFPKWIYDRQKNARQSERKEGIDYLLDEFFKRKDK